MSEIIKNNSDFLLLYEAINCNPNGDPDQENKPRMDYDTSINLVTDVRVKRFLRDYLKSNGTEIFVDMEGTSKVSVDTKIKIIVRRLLDDGTYNEEEKLSNLWQNFLELDIQHESNSALYDILGDIFKTSSSKVKSQYKKHKKFIDDNFEEFNNEFLFFITKKKYIDIRFFGSAVAVSGFPKTVTGAIQLNWGFSLNKVELIDSNSIVTIMNDGNSTFGKDHRLHYSLLAFNGTVNKYAAQSTGLTNDDVSVFRTSLWNCISAMPTRSKLNQYPKLYVELVYNEGYHNGYFGDLRNYVSAKPVEGISDKQVRKFSDLVFDYEKLAELIRNNKGEGKVIKDVIVKKMPDIDFPESF